MPDILIVEAATVLVEQAESSVLVDSEDHVVVISDAQQGPPGPPGVSSNASHEHTQSVASDVWTVNHNLGFRPAVSLLSVGGREMWAEVIHTSVNQFVAYFDAPTTGIAICS